MIAKDQFQEAILTGSRPGQRLNLLLLVMVQLIHVDPMLMLHVSFFINKYETITNISQ